jgi:hypothetical protein
VLQACRGYSPLPKKELEGKQKSMKTSFREMSDGLQCLVLLVDGLKEKDCRTSERMRRMNEKKFSLERPQKNNKLHIHIHQKKKQERQKAS